MARVKVFRMLVGIKKISSLYLAALLVAAGAALCHGAEFELPGRLTANGYTLLKTTADVSGNYFGVGVTSFVVSGGRVGIGTSAPQALLQVSTAAGSGGNMVLISTGASNVIRMTGAGEIYANRFIGDLSGASGVPGDNLGSHVATTRLTMGAYGVNTSSAVDAARYQVLGSTVLTVLPGVNSLALGHGAGTLSTGNYALYIGSAAGLNVAAGNSNIFIGQYTGRSNSDGSYNTAIGYAADYQHTADYDVSAGYYAGYSNLTGWLNVFYGSVAGSSITVGGANTYAGYAAGRNNDGYSSAIAGANAGGGPGAGTYSYNVLLGAMSGYNLTSGSYNSFIGYGAGYNVTTGSGNVIIGYNRPGAAADNMKLDIGGLIYGDLNSGSGMRVGLGTTAPEAKLDVMETNTGRALALAAGNGNVYNLSVSTDGFVKFGQGNSGLTWGLNSQMVKVYYTENGDMPVALFEADYAVADGAGAKAALRVNSIVDSGPVSQPIALNPFASKPGAGSITNAYGLYARVENYGGTITNGNALRIGLNNDVGKVTVPYGIYQQDTGAYNYLGGKTGVGTTSPAAMLDVHGRTFVSSDTYSFTVSTGAGSYQLAVATTGTVGFGTLDTKLPKLKIGTNFFDKNNREYLRLAMPSDSVSVYAGTCAPEGLVSAQLGSLYSDHVNGIVYSKRYNDGSATGWAELKTQESTHFARMYASAANALTANVWERVDLNGYYYAKGMTPDTTNDCVVINKDGYYLVTAQWHTVGTVNARMGMRINVNNASRLYTTDNFVAAWGQQLEAWDVLYLTKGSSVAVSIMCTVNATQSANVELDVLELGGAAPASSNPGEISGSGTSGKIVKFTAVKSVGDSIITENSGKIGISSAVPTHLLSVNGKINVRDHLYYNNQTLLVSTPSVWPSLYLGPKAGNISSNDSNEDVFIGYEAGNGKTTGRANTLVGYQAGNISQASGFNAALGSKSNFAMGYNGASTIGNVTIGKDAGYNAWGSLNTFVGAGSGYGWGTADGNYRNNVGLGYYAGGRLRYTAADEGSHNTFIGFKAGYNVTTGSGNIIIGYDQLGAAADKMKLNIGGLIFGDMNASAMRVGIATGSPVCALDVGGTHAMRLPAGTEAQRPASPSAGMLRSDSGYNFGYFHNGYGWAFFQAVDYCTGGNISYSGGKTIHTFYFSGALTCYGNVTASVLVVGGGGGGGQVIGGGGGAGGYQYYASYSLTAKTYPVTVGRGGAGAPAETNAAVYGWDGGYRGEDSVFDTIVSSGGGGGGSYNNSGGGGSTGGSGGGRGAGNAGAGYAGITGLGNSGGSSSANANNGAGGGGAGGAGGNGVSGTAGAGGAGTSSSISGASVCYAGGGGGGSRSGFGSVGTATCGGGAGRTFTKGDDATEYLGGGGGAGGWDGTAYAGGRGGAGVVIISYTSKP